jgi:hypothetical protein
MVFFVFMNRLISPNAEDFIRTRQGFNMYVITYKDDIPPITDINVSGLYKPYVFRRFADVEKAYEKIQNRLTPGEPENDLIAERIIADQVMLEVLQGRSVEFGRFILAALGFVPEKYSKKKIDGLFSELEEAFQDLGYEYDNESDNGIQAYRDEFELKDADEIEKEFRSAIELVRAAIGQDIKLPEDPLNILYEPRAEVAHSGGITTDSIGNFYAEFNTHPSRHHTRTRILNLILHEYRGHFFQLNSWKSSIKNGEMSPAAGITAITSPETIQQETVAAFAESRGLDIAGDEDVKKRMKVEILYRKLFHAVLYNAIIDINSGTDEDDVIKTMKEYLRFEDEERLRGIAVACRDIPAYRAGFLAYHRVDQLLGPVTEDEDRERLRKKIIPVYGEVLTISGLQKALSR